MKTDDGQCLTVAKKNLHHVIGKGVDEDVKQVVVKKARSMYLGTMCRPFSVRRPRYLMTNFPWKGCCQVLL